MRSTGFSALLFNAGLLSQGALSLQIRAPGCQGGECADLASVLKGYGPAETYCTKNYPVRCQTTTVKAPTSTLTKTVATITVVKTVATNTINAAPVTATAFATSTLTATDTLTAVFTDTVTVTFTNTLAATVTQNANKRDALPAYGPPGYQDPHVSAYNRLTREPNAYRAAVCTCLEQGCTSTVHSTPKVTKSVTATKTSSVTATTTATGLAEVTVTAIVTTTNVVAASSTTTTTTTLTVEANPIATVIVGNDHTCTPAAPGALYPGQCGPADTTCACYIEENGSGYCGDYYGACNNECTQNSDCPVGSACVAASETVCGFPICVDMHDETLCPTDNNIALKGKMMMLKGRALAIGNAWLGRMNERTVLRPRDDQRRSGEASVSVDIGALEDVVDGAVSVDVKRHAERSVER